MGAYDWIDPFEEIQMASRNAYERGRRDEWRYLLDVLTDGSREMAVRIVKTVIVPSMLDQVEEVSGEVARKVAEWVFGYSPPQVWHDPINDQITIDVKLVRPFQYSYRTPVRRP